MLTFEILPTKSTSTLFAKFHDKLTAYVIKKLHEVEIDVHTLVFPIYVSVCKMWLLYTYSRDHSGFGVNKFGFMSLAFTLLIVDSNPDTHKIDRGPVLILILVVVMDVKLPDLTFH